MARSDQISDDDLIGEFGVDMALEELDGYRLGQKIEVTEDDEDNSVYSGDAGKIIGFSVIEAAKPSDENYSMRQRFGTAHERKWAVVEWDDDGRDPGSIDLVETEFEVLS